MSLTLPRASEVQQRPAASRRGRLAVAGAVVVGTALLAGGGLLWARHGATVFFDLMSAGIAACL
ncbi:hypothetical protein ABLE93_04745 [Xanthobacter sp. KR7-65]|uniref:hypothetical protein n=1 Tax=Xanthobacter sp. KR7-65 TaxID=3156612 RepID=UPI0032B45976